MIKEKKELWKSQDWLKGLVQKYEYQDLYYYYASPTGLCMEKKTCIKVTYRKTEDPCLQKCIERYDTYFTIPNASSTSRTEHFYGVKPRQVRSASSRRGQYPCGYYVFLEKQDDELARSLLIEFFRKKKRRYSLLYDNYLSMVV